MRRDDENDSKTSLGHHPKRIGETQYAGIVVLRGAGRNTRVELLTRDLVGKTGLHIGAGKETRFEVASGVPVGVEVSTTFVSDSPFIMALLPPTVHTHA